jgi:hypothetical protein
MFYKYFNEIIPINKKINVIPYGIKIMDNINEQKPLVNYPYILYANNRFDMVDYHLINKTINTISDWLKENNIKLIITGNFILNDIIDTINKNDASDYVMFYNITNTDELNNLYNNSLCQICPEIIDGFGYTILEGWNNNCLTLVNEENVVYTALCDNAGLYFTFDTLVDRLNIILNISVDMYTILINKQREQLNKYNINEHINSYKKMFIDMINK